MKGICEALTHIETCPTCEFLVFARFVARATRRYVQNLNLYTYDFNTRLQISHGNVQKDRVAQNHNKYVNAYNVQLTIVHAMKMGGNYAESLGFLQVGFMQL